MQIPPLMPNVQNGKIDLTKPKPKASDGKPEVKDEYVKSEVQPKITYDKPGRADENTIKRLREESEKAYQHLRQLVEELLKRQGLTFRELEKAEIDDEARLEARAMLEEGGILSPEKVSDRIVEFAKAISGGDRSKIEMLRGAIIEGFKAAEAVLGGLPEISKKTYELVMQKLDAWMEDRM